MRFDFKSHDTKPTICPFCGYTADAAKPLNSPQPPAEGDLSMCLQCGEFSVFDNADLRGLRKPTDDEYTDIGTDPGLQRVRAAWVAVNGATSRDEDEA